MPVAFTFDLLKNIGSGWIVTTSPWHQWQHRSATRPQNPMQRWTANSRSEPRLGSWFQREVADAQRGDTPESSGILKHWDEEYLNGVAIYGNFLGDDEPFGGARFSKPKPKAWYKLFQTWLQSLCLRSGGNIRSLFGGSAIGQLHFRDFGWETMTHCA